MTEELRQRKHTNSPDGALPECRICFDGEESENNKLFRPCLCKGTQAYVHETCLNEWRSTAHNKTAFYQCPTCHYEYRVTRIWYAHLFINPVTLTTLTLLFIFLSVALVAYFLKTLAFVVLGVKVTKNFWSLSNKLLIYAVALIGFITLLVTLFDEGGGDALYILDFDPVFFDSGFFHGISYSLSAAGFLLFIKKVYGAVELEMKKRMLKLHERILEGHRLDED